MKTETKFKDWHLYRGCIGDENGKPYLHRISDMTEDVVVQLFQMVYSRIFGYQCDFELIDTMNDSFDSVGIIGTDRLNNSRIGFTIEKQRGVQLSVGSNKLMVDQFETVKDLLSRRFDLFGLIESGEAIDATTLK